MTRVDNPFEATGAGGLYARGRPYHHPVTLARAFALAGDTRVGRALDVACGTGLSTRALADRAGFAVGCELSAEMLRAAPAIGNAAYVRTRAEALPFAAGSFDTVTVASAVHWFEQVSFFAEVHRVLRPGGWLVLYDHYFMAAIREVAGSEAWGHEFMTRYPLPPRNRSTGEKAIVPTELFDAIAEELFDNDQQMTHEMLVDYAVTQSNSLAATERGEPVREWVTGTTAPFFAGVEHRTVRFLSVVSCFRVRRQEPDPTTSSR